jgi:hypothetical protein
MKLIDKKVYIEFNEMVDCGFSDNYLRKAKSVGTKSFSFIDDPDDKRKVLIAFEPLKDDYKKKIEARLGNPYQVIAKQPIRNLIKHDDQAEIFFLAYRYTGTDNQPKPLPIEHVQKYTKAASFLNMLKKITEDKKALKEQLNLKLDQFYISCFEIITEDKIDLPTSYKRLASNQDSALKVYIRDGYTSLINKQFGNIKAAKVKDELAQAVLLEMIANGNQYDDVFIQQQYNRWAKENDYKKIDESTVGVWRKKREHEIIMYREGNAALKNIFLRQVKGFRPSRPLYLVESDDNHLDLLFINPDDNSQSKYFNKYKAIVVTDSFNDYVLGYAYAQELSKDLVRAAYTNAMYHIRSITGAWHLFHESKTDRWGLKELMPFYKSMGKYFPTPVGSKNRGYIENFFGSPHWKRCLKIGANNYTGNNMTAVTRGVNTEVLNRNKKEYPLIGDEATQQIEQFFYRLRYMPQSNGKSKHDQWLEAFNEMAGADKRLINDEQFLLKCGIEHKPKNEGMRISNRGLRPQINGVKYNYDLATYNMADINKEVSIIYDPYDMSRVLATDFNGFRMMAYDARISSRALQDSETDSRTYLNSILNERKDDVTKISERSERRKQVLDSAGFDAEGMLQAGIMVKEIKQKAEQKMIAQTVGGSYDDNDEDIDILEKL